MNNNWYLAWVDEKMALKFSRLSFIDEVNYSIKIGFKRNELVPYLEFLKTLQNSMTLYEKEPQIATIRATVNIAKYFEKDMKRFLPSQCFKSKEHDGSVIFTLEYTQPLEILPLIQRWLPDLIIEEPLELKEAYRKKLEMALGRV